MTPRSISMLCRLLPQLAVSAVLVACGGVSFSISFSSIDRATHSGIGTFTTVVVGDPETWSDLWTAHIGVQGPHRPVPVIDFSSRLVIGVFLGTRPNGCYAVQIEDIQTTDDRLLVHFSERRPFPGEPCPQALSTPSHLTVINRTALVIEFVKTN